MDDWTKWLTEEERWHIGIVSQRCKEGLPTEPVFPVAKVWGFLRSLAASRALVAAKDKALEIGRGMEGHAFGCICVGEGDGEHSPFCAEQARALALTEEQMLKRLEEA